MRFLAVGVLAACMVAACSPATAGVGEVAGARISIIPVGGIDTQLLARTVAYMESQYLVAPVVQDPIVETPVSFEALGKQLVARVTPDDVCVLALCVAPGIPHQGIVFKSQKWGAVNVAALDPRDVPASEREGIHVRRVEKETLRAVALLVGMPPCPFPRCALRAHRNDKELDFKSRNPCPPCLEKVRQRLVEAGLPLAEEKPAGVKDAGAKRP